MLSVANEIEQRLHLRSNDMQLADRIHRIAEAALALKELDYLGHTRSGKLRERVGYLLDAVLTEMEKRHALPSKQAGPPERVKALRQHVSQFEDLDELEKYLRERTRKVAQHISAEYAESFRRVQIN